MFKWPWRHCNLGRRAQQAALAVAAAAVRPSLSSRRLCTSPRQHADDQHAHRQAGTCSQGCLRQRAATKRPAGRGWGGWQPPALAALPRARCPSRLPAPPQHPGGPPAVNSRAASRRHSAGLRDAGPPASSVRSAGAAALGTGATRFPPAALPAAAGACSCVAASLHASPPRCVLLPILQHEAAGAEGFDQIVAAIAASPPEHYTADEAERLRSDPPQWTDVTWAHHAASAPHDACLAVAKRSGARLPDSPTVAFFDGERRAGGAWGLSWTRTGRAGPAAMRLVLP